MEAVIDKDLASSLLAQQLKADILLLLTDVDAILYHSWDRVSPQARRRCVEQGLILYVDRSRRDGVAEAYVRLNGNAGIRDGGNGADANAAIFNFFAARRGFKPIHVEDHAVIVDRLHANGMDSCGDRPAFDFA